MMRMAQLRPLALLLIRMLHAIHPLEARVSKHLQWLKSQHGAVRLWLIWSLSMGLRMIHGHPSASHGIAARWRQLAPQLELVRSLTKEYLGVL
jgi:hypothetical protein